MTTASDIGYALVIILLPAVIIRVWKNNKKEDNNWK
jgi:hypothetical protein